MQKALNAIYGGVAFLRADANRAAAVKLIAEIDEIPEAIAARELDGNIKKLSATGEMKLEWMERALDMARLIGMTDLAPATEIFVRPVQAGARPRRERRRSSACDRDPLQIIVTRLALLALVLGAWELLPRNGIVNPLLLPPLGDVLAMLGDLLGRPSVHEAVAVTAPEVIVAFVIAVPLGAAVGIADRRERLCRRDLQADAVLRVQHSEIDLPADVHPRVRHRLPAEGRLCRLHHRLRRADERHGGGRSRCAPTTSWSRAPTAPRRRRSCCASTCRA